MNLQRFKQLESEVHADLHDYINIKRTVSGFRPQYCTPRKQVVTDGTEGLRRSNAKGTNSTTSMVTIRPYETDYFRPPTEDESDAYKLIAYHCKKFN